MKSFFAASALFAAAAMAQTIADLPSCSLQCIITGVTGVGCALDQFSCACTKSDQLAASVTPCVQAACTSAADQAKVISTLEGICAAAGFPITITPPAAPTSAAPEPSSAAPEPTSAAPQPSSEAPSAPSSSVAASSSLGGYPTSSVETCVPSTTYTTVTVEPSGHAHPTGGSNGTVTTKAPYPTQFTGAASANGVTFGAAGVVGLLAYLL